MVVLHEDDNLIAVESSPLLPCGIGLTLFQIRSYCIMVPQRIKCLKSEAVGGGRGGGSVHDLNLIKEIKQDPWVYCHSQNDTQYSSK